MNRKFRKIFNRFYIKIIILIIIFLGVVGVYFLLNSHKPEEVKVKMGQAALPVVYMKNGDDRINELHGYTQDMDAVYMRDSITPIPDSYDVGFEVDLYKAVVKKINYEVRSIDATNLVKKGEVSDWNNKEGTITADIKLDELVKSNTEYILILTISTENHDSIKYYTRILNEPDSYLNDQIKFVYDFNNLTFNKSQAEDLIPYLEPDSSKNNNSNFGNVSINSTYKQVSWGNLAPAKLIEPVITVNEQFGNIGSFTLDYIITRQNGDDTEYYKVNEYYRVNIANEKAYLLDFERTVNQIFIPTATTVTKSKINLGIDQDLSVNFKTNTDGNYICFSDVGDLWCMNTNANEITSVFTFADGDYSDIRNGFDQHETRVVNVDDEGNVEFLVYGYMNRGEHEGAVGVGLYKYNSKEKTVDEIIFIPSSRPYQILDKTLGKLLYVSENNLLYLMIDDKIYSVDITGNEYVEVASGLNEGNYVISYDNSRVAWQAGGSVNNATEIKVLDLKTGGSQTVQAEDGKYIKALGFLGDGFAYGVANTSDLLDGTLYMYEVRVVDKDNKIQKTENTEGIYYLSGVSDYNRINLSRVQKSGNTFTAIPDYLLYDISKKEDNETKVSTSSTDDKKDQLSISFINKVVSSNTVKKLEPDSIVFNKSNKITIKSMISDKEKYYVYAKGKVAGIYDGIAGAINTANVLSGVVVDDEQQYIWVRGVKKTSALLSSISVTPASGDYAHLSASLEALLKYNGVSKGKVKDSLSAGKSALEIINENLNNKGADLTGCSLTDALYFISSGQPLIAVLNNNDALLIIGYDASSVRLVNLDTGESYVKSIDETQALISGAGGKLLSVKQ